MVERLVVLLSGETVGHLTRSQHDDHPTFEYTDTYVRNGAVALSAQLPIRPGAHLPRKVMAYLAGLVPENDAARTAWSRQLDVAPDDIVGILAEMGWDCPGAVQFCREEHLEQLRSRSAEFEPVTEAQIATRIRGIATTDRPSWTMPGEHWSLGGQQEKFALSQIDGNWHAALGSAPTTHIFKPGIRHLHYQALLEHVTMAAAAKVGVLVAASTFSRFEDQWAIVVERFDRQISGRRIRRIHQEDFAQACGRTPTRKYESRGGPRLVDMIRIVGQESTSLQDDRLALADFLIINLVAGAPDGHAKNISMLRAPHVTGIAPLYDLASGLAYDSDRVDRSVAISIGSERLASRIRYRQWEKAAAVLGLAPDLLVQRVRMLAQRFPAAFEDAIHELPASPPGLAELTHRMLPSLAAHSQVVLAGL